MNYSLFPLSPSPESADLENLAEKAQKSGRDGVTSHFSTRKASQRLKGPRALLFNTLFTQALTNRTLPPLNSISARGENARTVAGFTSGFHTTLNRQNNTQRDRLSRFPLALHLVMAAKGLLRSSPIAGVRTLADHTARGNANISEDGLKA